MLLKRSREKFYQYEPYFNRTDGKPSWQWEFLESAGKYNARIALGGNRIGKSDEGAYEAWLAITGRHPYREFPAEGKGWIAAINYDFAKTINKPKFEKFMPNHYRVRSSPFHQQDKTWRIRGEGRYWEVKLKTMDAGPRAFEGDDVDWIWFDEEPPEDVFNSAMMRLIDRKGIWFMTATPALGTAWLKQKSEDPKIFTTSGSMWDNPYLPEEWIADKARDLPEEERLVRIEGKYIIFGGKPVFDVLHLYKLLEELKDRKKHPLGIRGSLVEAA